MVNGIFGAQLFASPIKDDEIVVFFNTSAYMDEARKNWNVPVHAWVNEPENSFFRAKLFAAFLEAKYKLELDDTSKSYFSNRTNLLIADNERGKQFSIEFAGVEYPLNETQANGQSTTILKIPVEKFSKLEEGQILEFRAILRPGDKREFIGKVKFLFPDGISVISDIDDTVKITQVTDHRAMFENTFYKPFVAVPGMASLYQTWTGRHASVHFVSSSPWQLYSEIVKFMQSEGFPWSSFSLKSVRFRDETLMNMFKKGIETKPKQIEPILKAYPGRKFILVGDSGEEDPEVYSAITKKYPEQILRVYIRSVNNFKADEKRMIKLYKNLLSSDIDPMGRYWKLFTHPSELSMPNNSD